MTAAQVFDTIAEDRLVDAHKNGRKLAVMLTAARYGEKYSKFAAKKQGDFMYNNKDLRFAFWAGFKQEWKRQHKDGIRDEVDSKPYIETK